MSDRISNILVVVAVAAVAAAISFNNLSSGNMSFISNNSNKCNTKTVVVFVRA